MNTWKSLLLGIVLGLLLSGAILLIATPPRGQPLDLTPAPSTSTSIMIYITGAVQSPGIYSLTRPARVNDAVLAAGGLLPSADPVSVNLAAKIEDGSQTVVASIDVSTGSSSGLNVSAPKPSQTPHLTPTVSYPIDINTAPQSLLEELPGIGPSKASAIITYRQEHGPFTKIEDILNVPGIGTGLFNSTKDLITVSTLP